MCNSVRTELTPVAQFIWCARQKCSRFANFAQKRLDTFLRARNFDATAFAQIAAEIDDDAANAPLKYKGGNLTIGQAIALHEGAAAGENDDGIRGT